MSKDYKNTINLPNTAFAMKADLAKREPAMLADWESAQRYQAIQQHVTGRDKVFIHRKYMTLLGADDHTFEPYPAPAPAPKRRS